MDNTHINISNNISNAPGNYCLIYSHALDGLGDISAAFKIAKWANKHLSISKEKIVIATNDLEKAEILNNKNFKIIPYYEAENWAPPFLQIIVPTSTSYIKHPLSKGIPTLCLSEYGFADEAKGYQNYNWIACLALGINVKKGQLGICIYNKLKERGFSSNSLFSSERIKFLYKANPFLVKFLTQNKEAEQFDTSDRLYLGYVRETIAAQSFIKAVLSLNQTNAKNLVIVLPGNTVNEYAISSTLNTALQSKDIQDIQLEFYNHHNHTSTILKSYALNSSGKTLRIITGSFYHADLKKILLASEKETVVTGDQSLSEAISANKNWFYETRDHKRTFAQDLQISSSVPLVSSPGWKYDHHNQLVESFNSRMANNYSLCTKLNTQLIECDMTNPLKETVAKLLSSRHDAVLSVSPDKKIIPADLPFGKIVKINSQQITDLKISTATMMTEVPGFENSIFEAVFFGTKAKAPKSKTDFSIDSTYLISRMKV